MWEAFYNNLKRQVCGPKSKKPIPRSRCIILAAGESERFDADYPKQHIVIKNERLIERILRQFADHDPILATHSKDIAPNYTRRVEPYLHRYTAETTLSTRSHWGDETLVLFSDVWFTDEAVETIKGCTAPVSFFTDGQDIFGFRFTAEVWKKMVKALKYVVSKAPHRKGNKGRIWQVYRYLYGFKKWPILPTHNKEALTFIGDATQDFDTKEDLESFMNGKSKNILYKHREGSMPNLSQTGFLATQHPPADTQSTLKRPRMVS